MKPDVLPALLEPFLEAPERAGIFTDFDGTLAPIVEDPAAARPLDGSLDVLNQLACRYRRVAIVSGRPASYLMRRLGLAETPAGGEPALPLSPGSEGLFISGLYGLEAAQGGQVTEHPDASRWRAMVERVACEADEQVPDGVIVERKGLSVTVHYRTAPEHGPWLHDWAARQAAVHGLVVHPARMSFELAPPIGVDKGSVVARLADGLAAVCFFGDDRGDLPAFAALDHLAQRGTATLKVVARSPEAPPELLREADLLVDGPEGSLEVMRLLLA